MAVIEGRWDCAQCQTTEILGRYKACPSCGNPRDATISPEEKVYFPDDNPVSDPELLELAEAGPDWNCGHCDTTNRGDHDHCEHCSQPRDYDDVVRGKTTYLSDVSAEGATFTPETDRADILLEDAVDRATRLVEGKGEIPQVIPDRVAPGDELPTRGALAQRVDKYRADREQNERLGPLAPAARFAKDHRSILIKGGIAGGGAAAVIALIVIIVHLTATHDVQLKVTSLSWQRQIAVEEYRTVTEEDWSIPAGGRYQRSFRAIHHYDTVFDGYRTETYTDSHQEYDGTEQYACGSRTVDDGNGFGHTETQYCTRSKYRTVYETKTRQVPQYHEEPVYREKFEYDIERWIFDRWVTKSGADGELDQPHWPEVSGLATNERVGADREEQYTVTLRSSEKRTYTESVGLATWRRLDVGDSLVGHVRNSGDLAGFEWPKKA